MKALAPISVDRIARCFEQGLSQRAAARVARCDRKTVARYWQWLKGKRSKPPCDEFLGLRESVNTRWRKTIEAEAVTRGITAAALCVLLLETCAKDDIFAAILDDCPTSQSREVSK